MRALWAAGGSAVFGSALLGVLVGMAIHGANTEEPQSRPPASTWVQSTTNSAPSQTEIAPATSEAPHSTTSAPQSPVQTPKKTTPPPAVTNQAPPPAAPPASSSTTAPSSGWPCSPLNPLPPPTCKNLESGE